MEKKTAINLFLFISILLAQLIFNVQHAQAVATITVTSASDNTTTDGLCTLREAIINANANFQSRPDCPAGSGNDRIIFAEVLNFVSIVLASDLPSITDPAGLTIDGDNRIGISGSANHRVFYLSFSVSLTLENIIISNGQDNAAGGGVFVSGGTLNVTNSQFINNSVNAGGDGGGAIYISSGTVIISNTLFYNNTSTGGLGGAIYLAGGTLEIKLSTLSNNTAFYGGAIATNSIMTISNTTFAHNGAATGNGGAISILPSAETYLYNNTLSENSAVSGGGININNASTVTLYNNIIANNIPDDCSRSGLNITIVGNSNVLENNSISDSCPLHPIGNYFIDPGHGEFNSAYFPLNSDSPVVNAGNDAICAAAPVNNNSQNGAIRPQGLSCDIGAYELPANDPSPTILSITRASTNPTSATSVDFAVVFSEVITGADINDFSISKTGGITGESVTNVSGAGGSYTVTVNTGSGSGTLRLDIPVSASIQDLNSNALSGLPFTSGEVYTKTISATFKSTAANDGWILESSETSNTGGTLNSAQTTFILGDDATDKQYRAILHFDTSALPDTAVVTNMTLKIKQQGSVTGTSPFTFASLYVDMRNPAFGTSALELADFNFAAKKVKPAVFNPTPVGGWYSARFNNGGNLYINRTGVSQLRLYFSVDDNNNNIADFIRFFSGNAAAGDRPKLLITYYVP